MTVQPIPDGYHTVTPYLIADDAAQLLDFTKNAFDAKEAECVRLPDGTVKHATVVIGNSPVMIGQASPEWPAMPTCLYLYVEDCDATFAKAVGAGGVVLREPQDEFYGDRSGGVKGPQGNQWWVGTHVEDVSPEEMERRRSQQGQG